MRLKKLILHGFKSFADRTEFVFDSAITGIVGPNGCGKSNVVDGFKWVLGEQSAKSLRGEAMLDCIFNGSGGRKPAGVAEVTLVFENPERANGARVLNLDADEVSVGRRLYRDGTSEYTLNNHHSRLKDIRELFMDTGVGVDAYSVIEQGRVSALLEANPEERRVIFEEAAGISKFKQKKKETQRKLEKVDQNLLRVNDIVAEVDRRLRGVKIQAGRARTFQEHSTRLSELRLGFSLREYHTHTRHLDELTKKAEDARFRLDDVSGDLQHHQNALAEKRQALEVVAQTRQRVEYELVQARASMQAAVQRQHYAKQQLQQITDQVASFEADRAAVEAKLAEVSQNLGAESERLKELTAQVEQHRKVIAERQEAFKSAQLELNQLNQQIEQNKSAILDLMRKLANTNSRLGAIEIERRNIGAQQARLADRRRTVTGELETLEVQRSASQLKLTTVLDGIADQQRQLDAKRAEAQQLGKQIAQLGEQAGAAREHRSGLLSRQKLLKDLESRFEGVSGGVKSVLRQRQQKFPFVRGLVADVLRVDVEHAHVIEAALDGRDQWLVATNLDDVAAAREAFEELEGRVNVVVSERHRGAGVPPVPSSLTSAGSEDKEGNQIKNGRDARATVREEDQMENGRDARATGYDWNQHATLTRYAVDLVKVEPADRAIAEQLLGRTIVVDTLADAIALHRAGASGWRFVTKVGEIIEADGTFRAGPLTASMGLLSRRSELESLVNQIADTEKRIADLAKQVAEGNSAARAIEEDVSTLRNAIYQSNTTKVELTSHISQLNDKSNALKREQPILDRELNALLEAGGRLTGEQTKLTEQKTAYDADQTARQAKVEELTSRQATLTDDLKQWNEQLTTARVQMGQSQEKQYAAQQAVQRMTGQRNELTQQVERIVKSAESVGARRAGIEQELVASEKAERTLVDAQKNLTTRSAQLKDDIESNQQAVRELARQVDEARADLGQIEQELHGLEIQLGEVKVRVETLVARTLEESGLDLPGKYAEVNEGEQKYEPADINWDAVALEIKELRDKIQRLGNVNLDSLAELTELEERQGFYAKQVDDLASAKLQLEQLIEEINTESSARFEATFNAVRQHFQTMFRKLFGGGKADVFLQLDVEDDSTPSIPTLGPDGQTVLPIMRKRVDPLDAGIEIMAHPPGKKPATISQLSGGEKTMTCIALLMSIFKSKPSPFCILDEVDAALDEANNQRFNLIVQEFLEYSQFIVITHSKRTMQIADVLYGVTMQEQGVSKRVAVKFDQVSSDGRISAEAVKAQEAKDREAARQAEAAKDAAEAEETEDAEELVEVVAA